jgi:hypothetical protein
MLNELSDTERVARRPRLLCDLTPRPGLECRKKDKCRLRLPLCICYGVCLFDYGDECWRGLENAYFVSGYVCGVLVTRRFETNPL